LRYLITGGAGFIGSHLAERLLDRGDRVVLLDNLSTGSVENIRHLKSSGNMQYHLDSIENRQLLAELVDDADVIVHLAAAVGVKLIVESPVKTIETNVNGTQLILEAACKKKKLVLTASTSEVYGKNTNVPFREDADLRKPGVGRLLNLASGKYAGLSSYLAGVSSLDLVSVPHPAIPNLVAIPTGPLPPNPADLLSSHRLVEAIAELRTRFKFIVIDSPPVMAATDAVILSVQADGVLLVVRSGETPKEAFTRTRDLLSSVKCRILGVVLNAVDASAPDYYYSYRYYPYSYGYGPQEAAEVPHEHEDDSEAIAYRSSRDRDDDSQAL